MNEKGTSCGLRDFCRLSTSVHNPVAVRSSLVRQLLPTPLDAVDPLTLYPFDHRPRPAGRPWLMANMVASVDGRSRSTV